MTTPQQELHSIAYRLNGLIRDLTERHDDEDKSILECIRSTCKSNERIVDRLEIIQNQMALIIKLLSKSQM
jgi:hypothetical protein